MLFHHLFNDFPEYEGYPINYLPFNDYRLNQLALLAKVCVAMFVFVTGYGLTRSVESQKRKKSLRTMGEYLYFSLSRWWSLMSKYWFIFLIMVLCQPLGRTLQDAYGGPLSEKWRSLLIDLAGLSYGVGAGILNPTAWYLTLAIWFIFLVPILNIIMDRMGTVLGTLFWMSTAIVLGYGNPYCQYLLCLLTGIFAARARLIEKADLFFNQPHQRLLVGLVSAVLAAGFMILRLQNHMGFGMTDAVVALLVAIICHMVLTKTLLGKGLVFLGEHSTNIFLFHTMLYSYYFLGFFFGFYYWWLVLLSLLVVSLLVGLVIEWLERVTGYEKFMAQLSDKLFLPFKHL